MYTVSITSQGQISIPAKIRKSLNLDKYSKAYVREENGKVIVEPVEDFMSLKGSLSKYAKKGMSIDEIVKMEEEAIGDAVVERYLAKEKRSGNKLLEIKP